MPRNVAHEWQDLNVRPEVLAVAKMRYTGPELGRLFSTGAVITLITKWASSQKRQHASRFSQQERATDSSRRGPCGYRGMHGKNILQT